MENARTTEEKKISIWARLTLLAGILIILITCVSTMGAIYLDLAGVKTSGALSNVAKCSGAKTCWTGKVEFTTSAGKEIAFYPKTSRFIFDLDGYVSESGREVDVRYFETLPMLAKVSVAYHLEYFNKITWALIGLVVAFFGWVATRKRAVVLDFSKGKK